jgi:hypothetical protein
MATVPGVGQLRKEWRMSIRKALKANLAIVLVGVLTVMLPALSAPTRADEPTPSGVGNDAVVALGQMSKTLQAKQLSFVARTLRAYAGPNGQLLHIGHTIKTVLSRPDRVMVDVTGDDGTSKLVYDGKNLVIYVAAQKKYASTPLTGGIDKALDFAEERSGNDFPLADLLANDPGESLLAGVTSGGPVGTATIDGVACRHFFFVQAFEDLEWEIWLEDNDRALPRRVVVTYRSIPGRPIFIAELSNWDFPAQIADSDFEFKPPADVTRVELTARASDAPAAK